MEKFLQEKMKRKDREQLNDDFSDFSLSSPARKIRRLETDLAPILEKFVESEVIDEVNTLPEENEERAIVLFNHINNTPLLQSPSAFSISVNSDLISGFKNPVIWSNRSNLLKSLDGETENQEDNSGPSNGCLAVVPWVPNHYQPPPIPELDVSQAEMMDAEDSEVANMDIEDSSQQMPENEFGGMGVTEGLNQWQQQCMIPQPSQNLSTPISWFDRHLV